MKMWRNQDIKPIGITDEQFLQFIFLRNNFCSYSSQHCIRHFKIINQREIVKNILSQFQIISHFSFVLSQTSSTLIKFIEKYVDFHKTK